MKGLTFDLQRFATTWLLTSNGDGTTLTLTDESDASNSKTWTSTHATNSEKFSFKDVIPVGDTVKLAEDITLAKVQFILYKDVTLDLNGKTLKATGDSPTNLITVSRSTACNFTITDTSDDGNGALVKETSGTSITSVVDASGATATITLERGNVINSSSEKSCGIKIYNASSSFTMTGGSIKTLSEDVDTRALDATGGSTCTINISGGTIESGNDGLRIKSKVTVNISGGNFITNNLVNQTSTGNTFNITGGVFNKADATLGITAEVVDAEGSYFTTETLAASIEGVTKITIDGTTKYYIDADKAQAALDAATFTATIDGELSYYSTKEKADAAVKDLTAVTIDGTTKYFTSEDTLAAAVTGKTKVTIDGEVSYYSTQEKADAAVKDLTIAKIGDDNYYTTLQEAVNAVQDDETIKLLKNATGNGVQVESGKNFILDFDGHTYDVNGTTVGSTGTKTQAFQLLKDSNITFKNGTITSSVAKMLVQNYSNLTLDNMTLDGSKLIDTVSYTSSNNNGTIKVTGNTSIIAKEGGYAFDVSFANTSYSTGPQVTIDTTGKIGAINFNTWGQGGTTFAGSLTIEKGTIGEITIDDDALKLGALGKITINGGTFANSAIKAGATLLVVDNVLVAKGWNSASDGYFYVAAPESGNVGTKLITVNGVTSTDQLKFDETNKVFAVPTTATATVNDNDYKFVQVTYDGTTATVTTTDDGIEITEKLLADTVTKISASGNANTVYISGGEQVTSIVGGDKNDTLAGTNADLTLTGGEGADIFVAGGNITVTDYNTGDKISVGADAGTPDIKVSGKNLVLTFGGNTVNLLGAAEETVTVTNGEGDLYYSKEGQTSSDGYSVTLPASTKTYPVKDPIKNVDGSKTSGVVITGDKSDNSLIGSAVNDKLLGNAGDDTLSGGAGGKDTFTGGKGNDVFVYAAGNAIITDYSASGSNGEDKISLDATPTSFKFSGSNLVLTFDDDKTLTVNGVKNKALTFIDGKDETVRTYIDNGAVSEDGKITLDQNFKGAGQNISKLTNVTKIDASTAKVKVNLVGNNEGNTLTGGTGDDTLTGGTGNDQLTGNDGADVFIYNGGADTVTDYKSTDDDTIKLKGQTVQSATFGGKDAVFTFNGEGNVLTLTGAANDTVTVKDNSNKVWTYTKEYTAQGNGVTLQASAKTFNASDTTFVTIDGSAASAVKLTGNEKNNVFVGSDGADTFVYSAGNDTITNYGEGDTVQVAAFGSITAAKFGTKTVLTVGKGSLTFKDAPKEINLVDTNKTATLTEAGIVTEGGIQLFNGKKTYDGDAATVDASNVKNNITLAGGSKAQTFKGAAGKTVYTYSGTDTMTIANYAAGDKISVNGSVTSFALNDNSGDVTLTIDGGGSIVIKGAANEVITLHDDSDKSGKYTARAYLATGITADRVAPTAVTLSSSVTEYEAPKTVKQITYTGGNVTITKFDTTAGRINHGDLTITDVTAKSLTFDGTGNTLTISDLAKDTKVQLTGTVNNKTVNSTVYLGKHTLTDTTGTKVSVTGGSEFVADEKIKTVTALGDGAISITGNALNNTLTANNAGDTLDGGAGTDVLIGGDGADIFIHDKITGTTTINGYLTGDSISLGENLSIVGSAYSPGKKNGSLTLTVAKSDNASTSKVVINSDDFKKTDALTSGTVKINNTSTSYGKNATYDGNKVELLPTYSGKFTASEGAQVDGSNVTKTLTLQGTTGNETLTGGAFKTTLTGGKGKDSLHGGSGADVFTYAAGDGEDVIADFTYNEDKLKVSSKGIISKISVDQGDLKFDMKDGGSVTIDDLKGNFFIKANSTLYWFDAGELVTASDSATKKTLSAIIKAPNDYAIVELDYSTNLVKDGLAKASATTFSENTFKKTT